jgi:hypothetical protein
LRGTRYVAVSPLVDVATNDEGSARAVVVVVECGLVVVVVVDVVATAFERCWR